MVIVKQDKMYATLSSSTRRPLTFESDERTCEDKGGSILLAQEQRAEVDMVKGQESRKDCGLETRCKL